MQYSEMTKEKLNEYEMNLKIITKENEYYRSQVDHGRCLKNKQGGRAVVNGK